MALKYMKIRLTTFFLSIILLFASLATIIPSILQTNSISVTALSLWDLESGKNFKNGTLENLSVIGSGEDARLEINLSDQQTWTKLPDGPRPFGYYYQEMASIWGDDKVLLFGGYGYYNDTWEFDLSDKRWRRVITQPAPSARYWQGMASVWGDDKVVLFGGLGSGGYLQDTWIYDSSDHKWTNQKPSGNIPYSGYNHNMATIWGTSCVMLFGGMYYNETWIYDVTANQWIKKSPTNAPSTRYYQGISSIHGSDKVLLYGGQYGSTLLSDTWIYDYSEDSWTNINPNMNPGGRSYHALFPLYNTNKVILYGGWWYNYDDVWVFDLNSLNWSLKVPTNYDARPFAGWYHSMAPFYNTDKALLFGGYYYNYLSDTWIYKHTSEARNGTYISDAYDTGSSSIFKTLSCEKLVPYNTSLRIQIRTAEELSELNRTNFVGPDGSRSTYYLSTSTPVWEGHNGDRWIQCRVFFNLNTFTTSPYLDTLTVTYNCIPTTIALGPLNNTLLANNEPLFSWTFCDFDSEVQSAFQVLISSEPQFESANFDSGKQESTNNQWQFPLGTNYTKLSDGTWYWKVRTRDDDGMWTEYCSPRKLMIDTVKPNSATIKPKNNGFYQNMESFSGIAVDPPASSGLDRVDICLNRLIDNTYWDGHKWAPLVSWLKTWGTDNWSYDSSAVHWTSGIQYRIRSRVSDNAGNVELQGIDTYFTIDRDHPISTITSPLDNRWLNDLDIVTGTSMDISGSGIEKVMVNLKCVQDNEIWDDVKEQNQFWDGTGWGPIEYWFTANGTEEWTFNTTNVKFTSRNQYMISSKAVDKSNNRETPQPGIKFNFDAQPPEELSIFINDNDNYTSTTDVKLSLSAKDLGSDISSMSFSMDRFEWSDWIPFTPVKSFELSDKDGEKTVYFRVRDLAGNVAEPAFDRIVLDTTPPKDLRILINQGTKYTKNKVVNLTLNANDALSGVSQMSFSFNDVNWFPWVPFEKSKFFTIPSGSGVKIVYFRVIDNANNIAEPVFTSINLDSTPPHSLSIFINKGATVTNSSVVDLHLLAFDEFSGINQMSFSFDGVEWGEWYPFLSSKLLALPDSDGEKTVYFRVMDNAGNIAEPVFAKILLNTTITEPEPPAPVKKGSSTFELWQLLLLIIILLILSFIALTAYFSKRLKRLEQQVLVPGAYTIKPGGFVSPIVSVGDLGAHVQSVQLAGTAGLGVAAQVGPGQTAQIPILAKSTQTAQAAAIGTTPAGAQGQGQVQLQELPQLPPAPVKAPTSVSESVSVPASEQTPNAELAPEPTKATDTTEAKEATERTEPTESGLDDVQASKPTKAKNG